MADIIVNRNSSSYSAGRVVWGVLWVVNAFLGLRFILKLIGANPGAGFTSFIYSVSATLLTPFANIVRSEHLDNAGLIEWSSLIAMIVYWLVAYAIVRLIWFISSDTGSYVERV